MSSPIEPQVPLLVVPAQTSSKSGTALIAVPLVTGTAQSASDGTGEEQEDTNFASSSWNMHEKTVAASSIFFWERTR